MFKKHYDTEQWQKIYKAVTRSWDYRGKDENDTPIYNKIEKYPTVKAIGTTKIHGTNACVGFTKQSDGDVVIHYQSRERLLVPNQSDNAGFATTMASEDLSFLIDGLEFETAYFYGEWAGTGIQSKVAVCQVPKFFAIFRVVIDGIERDDIISHDNTQRIYHISQFKTFELTIDLDNPFESEKEMQRLTEEVEAECPVGIYFGFSGLGEGIVWKMAVKGTQYVWKTKGDKHQTSKVGKFAPTNEKLADIKQFVELALTDSRLEQGLKYMEEMAIPYSQKTTGDFIRWVINDIIKEDSDELAEAGLTQKEIGNEVSKVARRFYFNFLATL